MRRTSADLASSGRPLSGEHERHLAISALAQQAAQVAATLAMLAAITALARNLTLGELGTYGLVLSFASYLSFVQGSIEIAAVKAFAEARDQPERDRAFSTALVFYAVAGLVVGGVIAAVGAVVLGLLGIPTDLLSEARDAVFALGAVTAMGWPLKVFQDALRGSQMFVAAATAEGIAVVVVGATLVGLALGNAPLWMLVTAGGSIPLATGVLSALIMVRRLPYRYTHGTVSLATTREFLRLSLYLLPTGIAELVIYSLDRAILAGFRSTATVGLYEGPVRAHNLILQVQSALATPSTSAAARYTAQRDDQRIHDFLLRGSRYVQAAVMSLTVVFMTLAGPILHVWLGPQFAVAGTAMTILVAYWLVNGGLAVGGRMLIAVGRARAVAIYAVGVALVNLVLSLSLTPILGLNGVVLGTSVAYALGCPFILRLILRTFSIRLGEFVREVWLPAYVTGAVVAVALIAVRLTVALDTLPKVLGCAVAAVLVYGAIYYRAWLRPGERRLVVAVLKAPLRGRGPARPG
jgi:O-antigen/teichoic acid export membrane protein